MKTLEPIIAKHPFFAGLQPTYLELITGCASNQIIKSGELLFHEGEQADHFYVIREGTLKLMVQMPAAGEVTLQTIHSGEIVGWSWLFPPYRWHFSGRAATELRVLAFDAACLRQKCETDTGFGYEFLKRFSHIMMERLQATRIQLIDLYQVSQ
ncbi:MAG: cyclic nucleotide-binding domain-containing protein [Anaerolineae bacterium]|jgi:CRP-like cAMP-binding protein|uniref:cyclic nucleotide-binding domain-containing protein n=1 Tax=Candidatus Flexifilum breve TaxID=3140694 RepID=UPI001AC3A581|nr:cyclic nucleotide-binding domain-containing protein [Chloroflexota bacterium]MBN8636251.1 cyclic nucleotide-binding domain-containing protein [Anaerolineae bacterium]